MRECDRLNLRWIVIDFGIILWEVCYNEKTLSVLMTFVLLTMSLTTTTFANNNSNNSNKIDKLLEKRAELICLEKYDEVETVEKQLAALGVEELTPEEVEEKFINTGEVVPYVTVPVSNSVTWMSSRQTYSYNGVTYEIQTLTAQPNSKASCLKLSGKESNFINI